MSHTYDQNCTCIDCILITHNSFKEKRNALMKILGIPLCEDYLISVKDLYEIFMDDEKCEALIAKLKNKAFW